MENLTIKTAIKLLSSKQISPNELFDFYNTNIKKSNTNSFITVCEKPKNLTFDSKKPLCCIPVAIKDNFCTKGIKTTAASKMLANFIPTYESTVTQRLLDNGAVFVGKTNLDEFAMGSTTKTSFFGPTISPLKSKKNPQAKIIPGGSSGGSAAAVVEDLCIAATGSDTGGSIRQPASFCGVVGFKPTYGRISRYGIVAYASSFDQAGFLTKSVYDSALLYELTAGHDGLDSTISLNKIEQVSNDLESLNSKPTIGIPTEFMNNAMDESVKNRWSQTIKLFEKSGCKICEISLAHAKYSPQVYYFIAMAEATSNLARYDGLKYGHSTQLQFDSVSDLISQNRSEGFGEEVQRRILIGTNMILKDSYESNYKNILKVRNLIKNEYLNAFKSCDVILYPTAPNVALEFDQKQTQVEEYLNDILTVPVNVAGLPAISVPCGKSHNEELPIGMQLIGKHFDETTLLKTAFLLEKLYS